MSDENAPGTSKENVEPTGGAQSSAQRSGPDQAAQEAGGATPATAGEAEQAADPLGSETTAEGGTRQAPARVRHGMFGVRGSGDTSGFGGLQLPGYVPAPAERPYGGWFDAFVDELGAALAERGVSGAVQQITIDRGEITFYVARERLLDLCRTLRDVEGDLAAVDGDLLDRALDSPLRQRGAQFVDERVEPAAVGALGRRGDVAG